MNFKPTDYTLVCCADGHRFEDAGWSLADPQCSCPSLVRAEYASRQYFPREDLDGFYRYADWLPVQRTLKGSGTPVTYKSKALASELGLENLYVTFSGWWPKIGARMTTCSFKETEAYSVCGRLGAYNKRILVVASAGNTARAFAKVCSDNNIPLLISIPEDNIGALWFDKPLNDCVKIMASPKGSDYYDAIALYGSRGFRSVGRRKNYYEHPKEDAIIMTNSMALVRIRPGIIRCMGFNSRHTGTTEEMNTTSAAMAMKSISVK